MVVFKKRLFLGFLFALSLYIPLSTAWALENFHEVEDGFFRGGQPSEQEIEALRSLGVKTIVSFRDEEKVIAWEREVTRRHKISFVSIPLNWKRTPTEEEARRFFEVVSRPERRPVFVHCREGRDRTGAMVAVFRIVLRGVSVEEATQEARRLGFRKAAFPLKRFIWTKAKRIDNSPREVASSVPIGLKLLFYGLESLVAVFGLLTAWTCFHCPGLTFKIQKRFYERINWRIEPVSEKKELRNTRIMGVVLFGISFLLIIALFLFSV